MKIAYIATSSIPSSTANSIQVMKVCQALTQNGEDVHLYIPGSGEFDWPQLKKQYGLSSQFAIHRIQSLKPLKRFDFILTALHQAKKAGAQVIYTRMLWVARAAQLQQIPVFLELHDLPAGRFGKTLFSRFLASRSKKKLVLITAALGRVIETKFNLHIPAASMIVAPDGVDLERYNDLPDQATARQSLGLQPTLTAVYTGGFYKGRGLELLQRLAEAFPQVQFLWVGGKPEAVAEWQTILHNQQIYNITLTGFCPNEQLPLFQAAADVLLMPFGKTVSGSSGGNTADVCSPMKMFEYMAAGRCILTSDLPVLREVLNENNASFYTPEDFEELKSKFALLISSPELRHKLAAQAKADSLQYSWRERMRKIITTLGETK